ncbi:Uncharacterized conserved protein, DUF58 family, contains vWF domain [Pelagirhabdus alkalitolerans]|uniref:Uncharacterized conserved protein, DUF58 family, contains vWF domain n=1 Tax=Pelagirhabdus alkalitolerans TaxID=1612202 RepID=A0A1G6GXF3_9BACI|nr:DUF58 domain-containing protein [Pelagirhabdus alkalitolerans]SDB86669.1 Uncharacterized conserved protein, DUF58 family, contains vWF domain [Pelagirhabdus alkalitolerans]
MNIAWFIVILILFIYAESMIYSKWGLNRLIYSRRFNTKRTFPNQKVEMIDEITNHKLLPIPWVRLESKIDPSLQIEGDYKQESESFHRTLFSLLPYQKITRRHQLTCTKRGVYHLDTVALTLGDMFGVVDKYRSVETNATLKVYPQLLSYQDLTLPAQQFIGEQSVKRWIIDDPFLKVGTRDYQTTDPADRINWKASARAPKIQVNQHDHTADRDIVLLMNADQTEDIWLPIDDVDVFERLIQTTATIAHYLSSNGEGFGFGTNAIKRKESHLNQKSFVTLPADNGDAHFYQFLDTTAELIAKRSRNFHYLLDHYLEEVLDTTDFLIITPIQTPAMDERIDQLRSKGHRVDLLFVYGDRKEHAS